MASTAACQTSTSVTSLPALASKPPITLPIAPAPRTTIFIPLGDIHARDRVGEHFQFDLRGDRRDDRISQVAERFRISHGLFNIGLIQYANPGGRRAGLDF